MSMPDLDDDLVEAARGGSRPAFERLVGRHQQPVRAFLRRVLGDWTDADDLAQDAFVAAWRGLDRYRGEASVRAWLCGIAYRKALDHRRARRRGTARDGVFAEAAEAVARAPAAEEQMDLTRALADLPFEQRAAVSLCLGADFSHAEAARALDLPLGTIKSHVNRGRARLLEALGPCR